MVTVIIRFPGCSPGRHSISAAIADVQRTYDQAAPDRLLVPLARLASLTANASSMRNTDVAAVLMELRRRLNRTLVAASALAVEAVVDRENWAADEPVQ